MTPTNFSLTIKLFEVVSTYTAVDGRRSNSITAVETVAIVTTMPAHKIVDRRQNCDHWILCKKRRNSRFCPEYSLLPDILKNLEHSNKYLFQPEFAHHIQSLFGCHHSAPAINSLVSIGLYFANSSTPLCLTLSSLDSLKS